MLTDLMYYPTRHSSSTSFFMFSLRSFLLPYQFHSTINKHIDDSSSFLHAPAHLLAVRKHIYVRGYPLSDPRVEARVTALTVSSH